MPRTYYGEEITAVPFMTMGKALSQQVPAPIAYPIAAVFRFRGLIGWPMKPTYAVGELGSETDVPREGLPPRALSKMTRIFETLGDLGFQPLKYSIADVIGEKEHVASLFLDAAGMTLCTVEWMRMRGADGLEEATPVEFNSYFGEDPDVMTGWLPSEHIALSEMMRIDFVDLHCIPISTPLSSAYQSHQQRTKGRHDPFTMTPEAALEEHARRTKRRFEWALGRGLLRPLRDTEVRRVKAMRLPGSSTAAGGLY